MLNIYCKRVVVLAMITAIFAGDSICAASDVFASTKSLRAMARVYMAAGEYAKAEPLLTRAVEICRSTNSSNEDLCLCLLDTSWLYQKQYKFDKAEQYGKMGLAMQEKIYFSGHPYIGFTLRNLAAVYLGQGKYSEARQSIERALDIMRITHQSDDPALASFKADLADIMTAQGDLTNADRIYRAALSQITTKFGSEHLYTAQVTAGYARLCLAQGRFSEAQSMLERSLDVQKAIHGPKSHLLAQVRMSLADVLIAKGRYSDAANQLENALSSISEKWGSDHPLTGKIMSVLGSAYLYQQDTSKAEKLAKKAVDILESNGAPIDVMAVAMNRLAQIYIEQGKFKKAASICSESLAELEKVFGSEHPQIAAVFETMAQVSEKTGDLIHAQLYWDKARAMRASFVSKVF